MAVLVRVIFLLVRDRGLPYYGASYYNLALKSIWSVRSGISYGFNRGDDNDHRQFDIDMVFRPV